MSLKPQNKPKLRIIRCCLEGCGRPKWRQYRQGSGLYIRLRFKGCCTCKGD